MKLFSKRGDNPKPENKLEELLIAATANPGARPAFYRELLKSDVFAVGRLAGPSEELGAGYHRTIGDTRGEFRTIDIEGAPAVPIFSSLARLNEGRPKGTPEPSVVRMNAKTLLESLRGARVVLNPFSGQGKLLVPEEIEELLSGAIFEKPRGVRIDGGEKLYLRSVEPPPRLLDSLRMYCEQSASVQLAYLAEIFVPSSGDPPHLIVGIQLATNSVASFADIAAELNLVVRDASDKDQLVDIFELGKGTIAEFMRKQTKPIFAR